MKARQILKTVIFILITLFIGVSLSYIVRTNGAVKDRFTGFYAEDKDTIDVMIYGASPANASFVPGLMWNEQGITSYSLSSNSQNAIAIKYLIEETYKYQDPQLLIIEPRMFAADMEENLSDKAHIREVTDNMRYSLNRHKLIDALLSEDDIKAEYWFDIIKYHSNIGLLADVNELRKFDYSDPSISKGHAYEERIGTYERDMSADTDVVIPIPKHNEEVLRDLLEYTTDKGMQVLFVSTPRLIEEEYEGKMNYIEQVVREYGYDFLNLNDHIDDMDLRFECDFYDGVHVNLLGAYVCTVYLGDYIADHYDIDKTHKGLDTASWDRAYEDYMGLYEPAKQHNEWKFDLDLSTREHRS